MASLLDELPAWARDLLEEARVGHLGLTDDRGHPRVLPVTYALAAGAAWSAVDDKPKRRPGDELARVRWLRARPQATLCIDRYSDDWRRLAWVQLTGNVQVLPAESGQVGLAALIDRYPPYRERAPRGPLLRLDVQKVTHWQPSR